MNLPDCPHGIPFGTCTSCVFNALQAAWRMNADLHRRIQKNEGAAGRLAEARRQLGILEATLGERKAILDMLGIAWSTRGAFTREGQLTLDQVKLLVGTVNRIQQRYFATEYRLLYSSVDEMVRKSAETSVESMRKACDHHWKEMGKWRKRAKSWKALAKKCRSTRPSSEEKP